ncbi:MAG: hypothetical protein C0606_15070 [Hyphomicrobiales bacterium]|nr:MAG: hypothetical protein C0606_15070 [Hyphomicrobiales bacterium]
MRLDGKRALVTGGTAGIGLAIARALAAEGAKVILSGRDLARAEAVAATLPDAEAIAADLSRPGDQVRLIEEVAERWPDLALLVNNAGMQVNLPATGLGDAGLADQMRAEVELNLTAPALLSLGLMPVLARQDEAAVVNITSGLAIVPKRTAPVYCATKAGLRNLTRSLRFRCEDAAPTVRMIDVVMSYVDTAMTAGRSGKKISADAAAADVLSGLRRGRDIVWVGKTRVLRWLDCLLPGLATRILRNS